jgi:hypothetical protein
VVEGLSPSLKADECPIKPGQDEALAAAIAHVLLWGCGAKSSSGFREGKSFVAGQSRPKPSEKHTYGSSGSGTWN